MLLAVGTYASRGDVESLSVGTVAIQHLQPVTCWLECFAQKHPPSVVAESPENHPYVGLGASVVQVSVKTPDLVAWLVGLLLFPCPSCSCSAVVAAALLIGYDVWFERGVVSTKLLMWVDVFVTMTAAVENFDCYY